MLLLFGLVVFPKEAWANAGTPLMWAGAIHLVIGNALIGVGEGLLLGWLFRVPRLPSVLAMVAANYASAWLGGVLIRETILAAAPMDLTNGWRWFWGMVIATYAITWLIEWPAVAWCLRSRGDWLKAGVRASFVIQTCSYVLLFAWYAIASETSLYTALRVVPPNALSLPASVSVYYITPSDGKVYRRNLGGSQPEEVRELHSVNANDRLFVRASVENTNRWDLVARLEAKDSEEPTFVTLLTGLDTEIATEAESGNGEPGDIRGTWFNFGETPRLGAATNSPWAFWTGFWPIEGLHGEREDTGERVHLAYETPFGAWTARNAVLLPGDIVLFQLGTNQICGLDPAKRTVALLWHGRGPVALIERDGR